MQPGEILEEECLEPMGISHNRLATDIGVTPRRNHAIVYGKRAMGADTALRLASCFEMTETFWSYLQAPHPLEVRRDALGDRLEKEVAIYATPQ